MPRPIAEITEYRLAELKKQLLALHGSKLKTRSDCELLSESIADKTGKLLSANTLRRILGIIPTASKPTLTTLDILSVYLGYGSYYEYGTRMHPSPSASSLSHKAVNDLYQTLGDNPAFYTTLDWALQLAFRENNVSFLAGLFDLHAFRNPTIDYTSPHFGNLLHNFGRDMQAHPILFDKLIDHYALQPSAQNLYFEFFVDYDLLPLRHHKAIRAYSQVKQTAEARLFSACLLFLRAFLVRDRSGCEDWIKKINTISNDEPLHPYPLGRKMACNLLYQHFFVGSIRSSLMEEVFLLEKSMPRTGSMNSHIPFYQMHVAEVLYWCKRYDEALQLITVALQDYSLETNAFAANTIEKLRLYEAGCLAKINKKENALSSFEKVAIENFDLNERHFNTMHYNFVASEVYKNVQDHNSALLKRSALNSASSHNFKVFESFY